MVEQTTCLLIVSGKLPRNVRRAFRHLAWLRIMDAKQNRSFFVEASNPNERARVLRVCKKFDLSWFELQDTEKRQRIQEEIQNSLPMVCSPSRLRRAHLISERVPDGVPEWPGYELIWP
ncbi:MAG: hypothetical protein HYW97_01085, partial [Candidatus Wildermuthbacteria bacterium]|nr:hypothetical protein [Candidatus Wildermuthbacteria bacterium]